MTPPASVEPVVLWKEYGYRPFQDGWSENPAHRGAEDAAEGRWLPLAAYTALMARIDRAEEALRRFADLGDESRYPRRPSRLDVPFEWYVNARAALRAGGG